jgi:hypothetical protein
VSEVRGIGATEFPSKRDGWLEAVVWSGAIVSLGAGLAVHATPLSATGRAAVFLACAASGGFGLWVLYSTRYVFDGPLLRISSGPFRFRVPLAEIDFVAPTRSPLSSPACSLDRLELRWRSGARPILISPEERPAFLRELQRRCPHLSFVGERATRYTHETDSSC